MGICVFAVSRAQLQALRESLGHEQHADRQLLQPLFAIVGGVIDAYDEAFGQPAASSTPLAHLAPPAADLAASAAGCYGDDGGNSGAGASARPLPVGFAFGTLSNGPGFAGPEKPGARARTPPPAVAAAFGDADAH